MQKQRCEELDIMKFWGILLVVMGHVTNMYSPAGLMHPVMASENLSLLTSLIYSFHMPLFVFVSGCVYAFQYETMGRRNNFPTIIKKKATRLLVPYVVFAALMTLLMVGLGLRESILDYAFEGFILSKDSRHLWFVLMLFEVFVLFWVLYQLINKTRLPKWSMLFFALVLYFTANHFPYLFQINMALKYLFWFTLGYLFILYKSTVNSVFLYISGGVILTLNMFAVNGLDGKIPLMGTITAFVGIMFFYHISFGFKTIAKYKFFQIINRNSFGIYLWHVFFIYMLCYYTKDLPVHPYILCTSIFVISLSLSVIVTELTRKLGMHIIIGEMKPHAE